MKLPSIKDLNVKGKRVLVRADLDVNEDEKIRLKSMFSTVKYLADNSAKIIVIGHKGRPGGKEVADLSLKRIGEILEEMLETQYGESFVKSLDMQMMENLRFNKGEEDNDMHFAEHLAEEGDIYVNEAFASSHREHASIVSLPKLLPHAAGLHFIKEVENLEKVIEKPKRPVVIVMGGVKKDKLTFLKDFKKFADKVLVGGRLPEYMDENYKDSKVVIARLIPDKEDLTIHSIENFGDEIGKAKTIVLTGPMGKYEEEGHLMGTKRVFTKVAESTAFKVAGGGDTEAAIYSLKLQKSFDWISVGGGATLEFLAKGTLPGIQALLH